MLSAKINLQQLTILFLVLQLIAFPVYCDTPKNKKDSKNLSSVRQEIQKLKQTLTHDNQQKIALQQRLKQADIAIAEASKTLQNTTQKLLQQQAALNQLNKQQALYQSQLSAEQTLLAKQIRSAHRSSNQEYLKMLLQQQNATQLSRMLTYYHYLVKQRTQLTHKLHTTVMQLKLTQQQVASHTQALHVLQAQQQKAYTELTQNKQNRAVVLEKIADKIQTKQEKLKQLLADEKALENVIQNLRSAPIVQTPANTNTIASTSTSSISNTPTNTPTSPTVFTKLQHKLPFPTSGKIAVKFGTPIEDSQLKWNGVLISAPEGQNVLAAAAGTVVFANWMPNFGLLLIIDHGNGYMTLYGHNNNLYKKAGDYVTSGDLIATVGRTGSYPAPGLYFAVRYNGKPLDPNTWLTHHS